MGHADAAQVDVVNDAAQELHCFPLIAASTKRRTSGDRLRVLRITARRCRMAVMCCCVVMCDSLLASWMVCLSKESVALR